MYNYMYVLEITKGDFMFLLEFNSTSLQREAGEVFKAAQKAPVLISRTGGKS